MENSSLRCQPGEEIVDEPYLALRITHWFAPYKDDDACRAIADIFARPCFWPLTHLELDTCGGKVLRHGPLTPEVFMEFITDPRCYSVYVDSGRFDPYIASARLKTGRLITRLKNAASPEESGVCLPRDAALLSTRIDAFCALATQLRPLVGCVSMEPDLSMAGTLETGFGPPPLAEALTMPGFTERRVRERTAYSNYELPLDREIWGPEWGLFLSRGHLARVPVSSIEESGVFARVQQLGEDLVYIQLTDDPMDTLRDDYDDMLDRARLVLAPILTDVSGVVIDA